jgi:hypothetical protein
MKKVIIASLTLLLCAATVGYSQSTTNTTGKAEEGKEANKVESANEADKDTTAKAADGAPATPSTPAAGGTSAKAKKPDKYSKVKAPKSILTTEEALEKRKKNMTEPDTTMKKGSGSAPKNMKNKTGKTSNYRNQAAKRNQDGK